MNGGVGKKVYLLLSPLTMVHPKFLYSDVSQLGMHSMLRVSTSPPILVIRSYCFISVANGSFFVGVSIMVNNSERNKQIKKPTSYSSKFVLIWNLWEMLPK